MAINLNLKIEKKDLWLLAAIMVFLIGVAYVIAYNSGASPSVMGHSADEIEGVCLSDGTNCPDFVTEYEFGGMYTRVDGGSCHRGNPYAGGSCACPDGYTAYLIYTDPNYAYWDGWVYFCGG